MKKILIVEDEFIQAKELERILLKSGFEVSGIAKSVESALSRIDKDTPDFVLIDIFLKGHLTGIDLAILLKSRDIPFLYLSANTNRSTLDAAKRTKPFGFLVKPYREKDVLVMLEIAMYQRSNGADTMNRRQEQADGRAVRSDTNRPIGIIGENEGLKEAAKQVRMVAPTNTSVLILGESGTGKELIAKAVHEMSERSRGPFIKINCGAIPQTLVENILFGHEKGAFTGAITQNIGKFEQAHRGTIFLDEIGEIPLSVQVKLLRVLQEKEVERLGGSHPINIDVRVVAATNRDLENEVHEGRFRMDLYYRVHVFPIHLPALRHRINDIPSLVDHFISKACETEGRKPFQIDAPEMKKFMTYAWPGNVRELENIVTRLTLFSEEDRRDFLRQFPHGINLPETNEQKKKPNESIQEIKSWQQNERDYLLYVLKRCKGKISGEGGAAIFLNLPPTTLKSKMKKLGIRKEDIGIS